MGKFEELLLKNKNGLLDDLSFLMELEDLAPIYLKELEKKGEKPTVENARQWMDLYQVKELYTVNI